MLVLDVNVLLYAHRQESPRHGPSREWVGSLIDGPEPFAVPDAVALGFVRIATNPRVYARPSSVSEAWQFLDEVLASRFAVRAAAGERVLAQMRTLMEATGVIAAQTTDAYIAAVALEMGATLVSADRGFSRFPGLSTLNPLTGV